MGTCLVQLGDLKERMKKKTSLVSLSAVKPGVTPQNQSCILVGLVVSEPGHKVVVKLFFNSQVFISWYISG